jgi:hypothetical protein
MNEGPAKRSRQPTLERAAIAISLFVSATLALGFLRVASLNIYLAAAVFLASTASVFASLGVALRHWRIGAAIGLLLGAFYLAMLFAYEENGGYWPGTSGWPLEIPKD